MLRRTLPALRWVKDGVADAAGHAGKGDAHFPSLRGHPAASASAREAAVGQAWLSAAEEERKMYRCRMIKSCTATCPKSLDPAAAISAMKALHQLRKA